ncbi:MAG: vanadium-dependent haloperoxidase [Nocardioides sp.]
MRRRRRTRTTLSLTLLAATCVALAPAAGTSDTTGEGTQLHLTSTGSAHVVLEWEQYSFDAVYPLPTSSIPGGVPVLGFTSLTMYDAVRASLRHNNSSEDAAVATAAHDILVSYAPRLHDTDPPTDTTTTVITVLDSRLATTLAGVPDGSAEDTGVRIGKRVAARFIASRVGDHFRDPTIHYSKPNLPGYWQPQNTTPPRTDMLEPWLGSLDTVVLHRLVRVNGPDALTSYDYARDYNEAKRYGAATSTRRSAEETQTSYFFNSNSATTVGRALILYLKANPMDLRATARLFGVMHAAMTDAVIKCWRLKRDVGFWRPREAVAGAASDGNPATTPEAGWTSLLQPEPPYSDYVSGHGCLTSPATETIRLTFGEETPLHLVSTNMNATVKERDYTSLSDIETDALNSRIWGGLHFRDAMEDAYDIGRETARRVLHQLP